jgi:membrane-bound serine protease (ClpP class)
MRYLTVLILLLISFASTNITATQEFIYKITISGAIGPAYDDYIKKSIDSAVKNNAKAFILELDTPGGLDKSMRSIIQTILNSPIPVITYISPQGARAASAGTYILYASHVAAMAPGTNLGAATPVSLTDLSQESSQKDTQDKASTKSTMEKKIINDAIAYIESLAQLRNRNVDWAKKAVKDGKSLSSKNALEQNVIDIVAENIDDLLNQIQEKNILEELPRTNTYTVIDIKQNWKTKLLSIIASPDVAYLLLVAGVYCLIFEFSNPGLIIPGALGVFAIIIGCYGLNLLPLSIVGILLMLAGIIAWIAEAIVISFGILGAIGTGLFILGSLMLIEPNQLGLQIDSTLIFITAILNALFFILIIRFILKAHKMPALVGIEALVGKTGYCLESFSKTGQIKIEGEIWNALTTKPLKKGDKVVVETTQNKQLNINKIKEET